MPKITQLELVGRRAGTQARVCQLPSQDPLAQPHGFSQQGKASLQSSSQKQQLPRTEPVAQTIHNTDCLCGRVPTPGHQDCQAKKPKLQGAKATLHCCSIPPAQPQNRLGGHDVHKCTPTHMCVYSYTHTHTHTHTPHGAFHPQCQPALPGTQSLAEPGREREGLAERVLGNSGPVNTSLGDLIRPPPGQRQVGEEVDNGQHGHGDSIHPGTPSSFWNKQNSARPGWEEGLRCYLPQTSQHQWVSP